MTKIQKKHKIISAEGSYMCKYKYKQIHCYIDNLAVNVHVNKHKHVKAFDIAER